jgi:transglutaminase-like putative cysteine protease
MKIKQIIFWALSTLIMTNVFGQIPMTDTEIEKDLKDENYTMIQSLIKKEYKQGGDFLKKRKIDIEYTINTKTNKLEATKTVSNTYTSSYFGGQVYLNEFIKLDKITWTSYAKSAHHKISYTTESYETDVMFYTNSQIASYSWWVPYEKDVTSHVTTKYEDARYLSADYLLEDIPSMNFEMSIKVPKDLKFELVLKNTDSLNIKKTSVKEKDGSTTYTYKTMNLPPFQGEYSSQGPSFIYPHAIYMPKTYTSNGKSYNIFDNVDGLYEWCHSLVMDMKQDKEKLKLKVNELIKDKKTEVEKAQAIYYWVQDHIRYIAYEDGIAAFKPASCNEVYDKKYGDCKGMANLAKEMLILAGLDARLTWIGTNHLNYDFSTPTLVANNHMICTVYIKGKAYFIDPTEKYIAFNDYAERIQGRPVMIENGAKYILDTIPKYDESRNKTTREYNLKLMDEKLIGTISNTYKGEGQVSLMNYYNNILSEHREKTVDYLIKGDDQNIYIQKSNTPDFETRTPELNLKADVEIKNKVSKFDNDYYIEFDLLKSYSSFKFDTLRKFDYNLDRKYHDEFILTLAIPSNLKVKHLPENYTISTDLYSVDITFTKTAEKVVYKKVVRIKNAIFDTKEFKNWNDIIDKINKDIHKEMIVLTKK